jgi:hypothetical protein
VLNTKTRTTIRLKRLHPAQRQIADNRARFRVVACGRRFGKTELGKHAVLARLARGWRCWWLAPTYQMASQVWRDLKTRCGALAGVSIHEKERRIDLPGGGMLAIRSTHQPDHLRGEGLDFAVLDEAAFMEAGVWPQVVRPMLLERRGRALFLSTPYGHNWFWEVYQRGLDPAQPEWVSFHFTSYDNPRITAAELDSIRRVTSERVWREEYLAEFVDDSGQVFRGFREVAALVDAPPVPGRRYVAGLDWGREDDYTALVVMDADSRQMVALDRFRRVSWSQQRARVAALCARWQPVVLWAEANSIGAVNIEALQADGLPVRPFTTTTRSKAPLIEGLALAIERGQITLLADETLLGELAAYRMERLPGGGYRYGAPPGMHDDCVMAAALAWYGVGQGGISIDFA